MTDDPVITAHNELSDAVAWSDLAWTHCGVGLCLIDLSGTIKRANATFCRSLGYADNELNGVSVFRLHSADHLRAMEALHDDIVTGKPESTWASKEMVFEHASGRPVVSYSRNRCVKRKGQVMRLITLLDLAELGRGVELAEQVHRAKNFSALAGVIANDLNNLLSIVLGYTALLHDPKVDLGRIKIAAEGVDGAVSRASTLVRQTLYLARRPDPVTKVVDFPRFVEHTLGSLRSVIGNRPIESDLSLSRALGVVRLDPGQMTDAIAELFELIKAIEPKAAWPVRVSTRVVEGQKVRERFGTADEPSYVLLEIVHPAQPRTASRAPFAMTERTPDAKAGLNLGMTMVERIMDGHHGFLGREVLTGQGLAFSIYLPLAKESTENASPVLTEPSKPSRNSNTKPTVMVVDDETGLLDMIASALRRTGYEVFAAKSGEEAIEIYKTNAQKINLSILDLVLPQMSGWEVFNQMREINPGAQVMIMSGHLEPKLHSAVSRSGAKGFIQKPFAMATFLRRIGEIFER